MTEKEAAVMEAKQEEVLKDLPGVKVVLWGGLMVDLMKKRKASQPLELPSAGSTFKRPEGYFSGKLVQDAGLKGLSVGGAQVSEKHAGFVINRGNATCADMKALAKAVHDKVLAETYERIKQQANKH
mgnify:CR=1 FL=1